MKVINIPKWIGDSTKFFTNFPSIKVPAKFGLQSALGKIHTSLSLLRKVELLVRVTKLPDLSLFIPILGLPKLLKHLKILSSL